MFKANALKTKKYDKIAFKSVYWQQENFQKEGNVSEKSERKDLF
ncbi:CLPTM1 family protein [Helicobacter pylori]|nr:CLPTM1 family protein [Helicobacter pylori]